MENASLPQGVIRFPCSHAFCVQRHGGTALHAVHWLSAEKRLFGRYCAEGVVCCPMLGFVSRCVGLAGWLAATPCFTRCMPCMTQWRQSWMGCWTLSPACLWGSSRRAAGAANGRAHHPSLGGQTRGGLVLTLSSAGRQPGCCGNGPVGSQRRPTFWLV